MKQEEDVYRYLYHFHPTHPFLLQTENQLLLNVFEHYDLFTMAKLNVRSVGWFFRSFFASSFLNLTSVY